MTLLDKVRTGLIGYWILLYWVEVDNCIGKGPGCEVWFQVEKYGRDENPGFDAWFQVMDE